MTCSTPAAKRCRACSCTQPDSPAARPAGPRPHCGVPLLERAAFWAVIADAADSDARDRVGKQMGISGRHVQRFLSLAKAPQDVQQAVRDRKLSLVQAKIGNMTPKEQAPARRRPQSGPSSGCADQACWGQPGAAFAAVRGPAVEATPSSCPTYSSVLLNYPVAIASG